MAIDYALEAMERDVELFGTAVAYIASAEHLLALDPMTVFCEMAVVHVCGDRRCVNVQHLARRVVGVTLRHAKFPEIALDPRQIILWRRE